MTLDQYNALVDAQVTNKTAAYSISPNDVGSLLKIGANLNNTLSYSFEATTNSGTGQADQTYTLAGQPDGSGGYLPNLIGGSLLFVTVEGISLTLVPTINKPTPDVLLVSINGMLVFNAQLVAGQTINIIYKTA